MQRQQHQNGTRKHSKRETAECGSVGAQLVQRKYTPPCPCSTEFPVRICIACIGLVRLSPTLPKTRCCCCCCSMNSMNSKNLRQQLPDPQRTQTPASTAVRHANDHLHFQRSNVVPNLHHAGFPKRRERASRSGEQCCHIGGEQPKDVRHPEPIDANCN